MIKIIDENIGVSEARGKETLSTIHIVHLYIPHFSTTNDRKTEMAERHKQCTAVISDYV